MVRLGPPHLKPLDMIATMNMGKISEFEQVNKDQTPLRLSQTSRPLKQVLERRLPQNSFAQQSKEISTDIDSS